MQKPQYRSISAIVTGSHTTGFWHPARLVPEPTWPRPQSLRLYRVARRREGRCDHGATDDLGCHAVEHESTVYDLWATVLHQFGVDHESLTYRHGGRDFRLTDVHGRVLHDILA